MRGLLTAARLGAAVPAVVLALAVPAAAATVTGPVEKGASITAHGTITLTGVIDERDRTGVAELRVAGPQYPLRAVARAARPTPENPSADPATVSFSTTTAPCALPESAVCAAGAVLPNGRYDVRLFEVDRLANEPERELGQGPEGQPAYSVLVDVPAGAPQDVAATLAGRTVTVTWARASGPDKALVEPDVLWTVSDGAGRSVEVDPQACADGVCRAAFEYPDDVSGPRSYTVSASRPCSGCTNAPVAAEPAGPVAIPVVPGATPGPGGPAGGGAGRGGSGTADPDTVARGLGGFGPRLRLPGLPSASGSPSVAVPQVADGTFEQRLDYGERPEVAELDDEPVATGRPGTTLSSTGGLLSEEVVRGIAGALVLALSGAHLRAWLSRAKQDAELL